MEASLSGDGAMRNTAKLTSNSLFGVFGIEPERECIKVLGEGDRYILDDAFKNGKMLDLNKCGETTFIKVLDVITTRCSKVDVSARITVEARRKQWETQVELINMGHELLFGDTDSICVRINGSLKDFVNSGFYNLRVKGGQGEILGLEKDEFFTLAKKKKLFTDKKEKTEKYLKSFGLAEKDELMPFDKCAVIAAKGYFCYSTELSLSKHALKGGNFEKHFEKTKEKFGEGEKIDFEKFVERLVVNDELILYQDVFKSGGPSFFDYDEPLRVRVEETTKTFRKIYQKGKIIEVPGKNYKIIEPFTISEIEEIDGCIQEYPIQKVLDSFLKKE